MLFLLSCATSRRYEVEIDGIAAEDTSGKTFIILSASKEISSEDLRFQEFQKITSNVLKQIGYVETKDAQATDLAIFLDYFISDGSTHTETRSIPVFGQQQQVVNFQNSYGQNIGSATVQNANPYAPSGFRYKTEQVTTYYRKIVLNAFDVRTKKQVWESKITSNGYSSDIRTIFPFMLIGASPYLGKNTGKQLSVDVYEGNHSQEVERLKQDSQRLPASGQPTNFPEKPVCSPFNKFFKIEGC
jgi:hypothetical protein